MQLNEISYDNQHPIEGYGPGFFRINGQVHEGPLGMLGGQQFQWAGPSDFSRFIEAQGQFDVLFIGMGAEIAPLPKDARDSLEEAGLGFDLLSSPSACRTYNVLLSEGRRVALALLPV